MICAISLTYKKIESCRSAALFQMNYYKDCIKDIDRALECGYPKPQLLYMLHLRKAKCLKFLKKDYDGCVADTMQVNCIERVVEFLQF
jgi:hypothetical protein